MTHDKKMSSDDLGQASGGANTQDVYRRLGSSLSDQDIQRLRNAQLSDEKLKQILGAGSKVDMAKAALRSGVIICVASPDADVDSSAPSKDVLR